jgi:type II secretion system protein J
VLLDFAMAEPHSLTTDPLSLRRTSTRGSLTLHYRLTGTTLHRDLADATGTARADQPILTGVESLSWRFLTPDGQWSPTWPADATPTLATPRNPRAVEVLLTLPEGKGTLRRVAPLPADLE